MTTELTARDARNCHNAVNPVHSALYFSTDLAREFAALGIDDRNGAYFGARSASLGAVGAGTVTATFYNFKYEYVARHVPAVWQKTSPEAALEARERAVDATLRRVLGEDTVASADMAEAAQLTLRAAEACTRPGRPLYASLADLPVPTAPHLAFWHAAGLLREYRGDGHIAALVSAGLGPLEALVTHTASGRGTKKSFALASRGWSEQDWQDATVRLTERGILDASGELTEVGAALRKDLERRTDEMDRAPYLHLGPEGVARLTELGNALSGAAYNAGAFPDVFGRD